MRRHWLFAVVASFASLVLPSNPASASTLFLLEPFGSSWTAGSNWIVGTGATFTPQIVTDNSFTPPSALRLTSNATNLSSALIYKTPQPMSQGLDVSFRLSQWGGSGADGMSFFLQKGTETSSAPGSLGGALGYSAEPGHNPPKSGLPNGLLGIGFDRFGNFSNSVFGGSNCSDGAPATTANSLVIRGPGNGMTGYCRLAVATNSDTNWTTGADTRVGRGRSVRIVVDPSTASTPQVKVWVCAVGSQCNTSSTPTLAVNAPAELVAEPTVRFGFAAGTGGLHNFHEIWDLAVGSQATFPAAAITTTSLASATVGSSYSETVNATGVSPITFAVTSGSLPTGLSLNSTTGAIAGTPTSAGTFTFTVEATDTRVTGQAGRTATRSYTLTVSSAPTTTPAPTTTASPTTTAAATTTTTAPAALAESDTPPDESLPAAGVDTQFLSAALVVLVASGLYMMLLTSGRRRDIS